MEISWITSLRSVNQFPGLPHFVRFSSLGFIVDQSIFLRGNWITSLRSVFLKCLKSNKEKSSVCNAFFFYETHLILGLPHFIRFSSLGFIVDQSIFLLRKMDAFFFF
jgi:hypothetical protein